jgi:hypothetical protein
MHYDPTKFDDDLDRRFSYHPPFGDQPERFVAIRQAAREFADLIVQTTPYSREQSTALTHLDQVVMWANAAIARHETNPEAD